MVDGSTLYSLHSLNEREYGRYALSCIFARFYGILSIENKHRNYLQVHSSTPHFFFTCGWLPLSVSRLFCSKGSASVSVEMNDEKTQKLALTLERLATLVVANDVRYSERYEAQQTAMQTALVAQKLTVDTALAAADRAVTKSEIATEKRFDSVNEFRGLVNDLIRTLMPRPEAELLIKGLSEKIDTLTVAAAASAGQRSGIKDGWLYLLGAVSIIGSFSAIILHFVK